MIKIGKTKFDMEGFIKKSLKIASDSFEAVYVLGAKDECLKNPKNMSECMEELEKGNKIYVPFASSLFEEETECADGKKIYISEEDEGYYGEGTAGVLISLDKDYKIEYYQEIPPIVCHLPPDFDKYSYKPLTDRMEKFIRSFCVSDKAKKKKSK